MDSSQSLPWNYGWYSAACVCPRQRWAWAQSRHAPSLLVAYWTSAAATGGTFSATLVRKLMFSSQLRSVVTLLPGQWKCSTMLTGESHRVVGVRVAKFLLKSAPVSSRGLNLGPQSSLFLSWLDVDNRLSNYYDNQNTNLFNVIEKKLYKHGHGYWSTHY